MENCKNKAVEINPFVGCDVICFIFLRKSVFNEAPFRFPLERGCSGLLRAPGWPSTYWLGSAKLRRAQYDVELKNPSHRHFERVAIHRQPLAYLLKPDHPKPLLLTP